MAKEAIANGADPNKPITFMDSDPIAPLIAAAVMQTNAEIVDLLLKTKAETQPVDKDGNTALHWVMQPAIVRMLFEAGANFNVRNKKGQLPWERAQERFDEVIQIGQASGGIPKPEMFAQTEIAIAEMRAKAEGATIGSATQPAMGGTGRRKGGL